MKLEGNQETSDERALASTFTPKKRKTSSTQVTTHVNKLPTDSFFSQKKSFIHKNSQDFIKLERIQQITKPPALTPNQTPNVKTTTQM